MENGVHPGTFIFCIWYDNSKVDSMDIIIQSLGFKASNNLEDTKMKNFNKRINGLSDRRKADDNEHSPVRLLLNTIKM